jgi:hypothetical protein
MIRYKEIADIASSREQQHLLASRVTVQPRRHIVHLTAKKGSEFKQNSERAVKANASALKSAQSRKSPRARIALKALGGGKLATHDVPDIDPCGLLCMMRKHIHPTSELV